MTAPSVLLEENFVSHDTNILHYIFLRKAEPRRICEEFWLKMCQWLFYRWYCRNILHSIFIHYWEMLEKTARKQNQEEFLKNQTKKNDYSIGAIGENFVWHTILTNCWKTENQQ